MSSGISGSARNLSKMNFECHCRRSKFEGRQRSTAVFPPSLEPVASMGQKRDIT